MLQLTLARDHLLCGYGSQMDPSVDLRFSGQAGDGCRPSLFFGPSRDALSLVTRRLHAALLLRPRRLDDLEPRLWVLALPGGDPTITALWRQKSEALGAQIRPLVRYSQLQQSRSELERTADVYHQTFATSPGTSPLEQLRLHIEAVIDGDALREQWHIEGLPADWTATLAYWFQPEIGASQEMQSCVFHEPSQSMVGFRGGVFFGLQALQGASSLPVAFAECGADQHQLAAARWSEVLSASWERDAALGLHAQAQAKAPSWWPLEPRGLASLGRADGLVLWQLPQELRFELRFRLTRSLDAFQLPMSPAAGERVRQQDQSWLKACKPAPAALQTELKGLYARTLLTLRQMQDPDGGIIAAPEFHYALTHCGGYGYCWGRDAGFISYAMDVCGMQRESAHFYRYMQRCQSEDGSFLHRHDMQGHLGASWGLLQPDETGSVLFGLWQHLQLGGERALMDELKSMIVKAADWLAAARHSSDPELPIEGFDLWEEREGVHLYTVAAMAAGLEAAVRISETMGWPIPASWQERAQSLRALCTSSHFIESKDQTYTFARTLRRRVSGAWAVRLEQIGSAVRRQRRPNGRLVYELDRDHVADISQLALVYPYAIVDGKSPSMQALMQGLDERLWRPGQGGIGRYEADHYRDGNPWILTTLWLALAAAEHGQLTLAKKAWNWVVKHTPPEGQLPEQIDPENGKPAWVMPLTWSHAMFALAIHQLPQEVLS